MHAVQMMLAALTLLPLVVSSIPCNEVRKLYAFTPCNAETGMMNSVEYYNQSCEEVSGDVLMAPRPAPCVRDCPSGTWYSPQSLECDPCEPGEVSNSGGVEFTTFEKWPSGFASFCFPQPCAIWQAGLGGATLQSGNQTEYIQERHDSGSNEDVDSSLVSMVNVINTKRGGLLSFQYRVESERNYDGLLLFVNETPYLKTGRPAKSIHSFLGTGVNHQWSQFTLPLPFGVTEVRWVYRKDSSPGSSPEGQDRAFLRNILFEGLQWFASRCTKCGAGRVARSSQSLTCDYCPAGTRSGIGSSTCTSCNSELEYSPAGSSQCYPRETCGARDYVPSYTECKPEMLERNLTWVLSSKICRQTDPHPPQNEGMVACAPCMKGFFRSVLGHCNPCPKGSRLQSGQSECSTCEAGTAAIPIVSFSNGFEEFGALLDHQRATTSPLERYFRSTCSGGCGDCKDTATCEITTAAFEPFSLLRNGVPSIGLSSLLTNSATFTTTLEYQIMSEGSGIVEFEYMFHIPPHAMPPDFSGYRNGIDAFATLDGIEVPLDPYFDSSEKIGRNQMTFRPGSQKFSITLSMVTEPGEPPISVVLVSLVVVGDMHGSATSCTRCTPGHYCPLATSALLPCPPGTSMFTSGAAVCDPCPNGTVSAEGYTRCSTCGTGTKANQNRDSCMNECGTPSFSFWSHRSPPRHFEKTFDFSPLRDATFGPIFASDEEMPMDRADELGIPRYFFSPCGFVNADKNDSVCHMRYDEELPLSYVCKRTDENRSASLGQWVSYSSDNSDKMMMIFTHGDYCYGISPPQLKSTIVQLICDPDPASLPGHLALRNVPTSCRTEFSLTSFASCPKCTMNSFTKKVGPCRNDSTQEVSWYKTELEDDCVPGFPRPPKSTIPCDRCRRADYYKVWNACENRRQHAVWVLFPDRKGCIEDGSVSFDTEIRSCTAIDASFGNNRFTWAAGVVLFVVLALFVWLIVVLKRHRNLRAKYSRLAISTTETDEMQRVETANDADDSNDKPV